MPRIVDDYWNTKIYEEFAKTEGGPTRVIPAAFAALKSIDLPESGQAPPSLAHVRRQYEVWRGFSVAEKERYMLVRWPESFVSRALPWESARVLLDALPVFMADRVRPTVPWARWYWRLHLAASDAPAELLMDLAELMRLNADDDDEDATDVRREVEAWIAYRPWTEAGKSTYLADVKAKRIPQLRSSPYLQALGKLRDDLTQSGRYEWKTEDGFVGFVRTDAPKAAPS